MIVIAALAVAVKVAAEHERVVVFRLGRLVPELKGPGLFLVVPLVDRLIRVDLRTRTVAEALGVERWLQGKQGVVERDGFVTVDGQRFRALARNGSALVPGAAVHVHSLDDNLRLVVGSTPSPTEEGTT